MGRPAASGSKRPPSRSAGRYGRLLAADSMRPRGNQGGPKWETFLRSPGGSHRLGPSGERTLKIAYFGLPLGALLLTSDGHRLALTVLSPVEAPGRRRL